METEKIILKLLDYGGKLIKKIEKSPSFDAASTAGSISDGGSGRGRRCSEQARRMSGKVGRLELDVQKIHFVLMKLDSNKVSNGKTCALSGTPGSSSGATSMVRGPRTLVRPSTMYDQG